MSCCDHTHSPLLIDIGPAPDAATDVALESLYKALADPGDDKDIWEPHHSPFIRTLIEVFTQRGVGRINAMLSEFMQWIHGEHHKGGTQLKKALPYLMERWSPELLDSWKFYLESKPTSAFDLDDWMGLVDYLVQRYLPSDLAMTEADWLSRRAVLMGRVMANVATVTLPQADTILASVNTVENVARTRMQQQVLQYGRARCAENISAMTDAGRHRIKTVVMQHQEAIALGNKADGLETSLFDAFGAMNRDWRRIAVTEAGEMANQGQIASLPEEAKVKRLEMYAGACPFCRAIDGRVLEVVSPDAPKKDGETQVWPGKTNIGRAAAPRRRIGSELIDRLPSERWWPAAGVQHPHCRGSWLPLAGPRPGDDPEFAVWLENTLGRN